MEYRVVRFTDRFDEACRFWHELLGWPVTREWPATDHGGRGRIFGYGDVGRIELIEAEDAVPVAGVFLAFEHPEVDALHDRLVAAGVTVLHGPTDQPWGHRSIRVVDPSGIEVAVFRVQ